MPVDMGRVTHLITNLLDALGEDSARPGLRDTPTRVARFWTEFLDYEDENIYTVFESVQVDQMVVVSGIHGWSICEHHLLPFSFTANVCYVTGEQVIGVSKSPRIVKKCARRLQLQERLTNDIADELERVAKPKGVGVVLTNSVHTCMVMRGIEAHGSSMATSCMRGVMLANPVARQEFLDLLRA